MAASLAVEWAKSGIRVNALRSVYARLALASIVYSLAIVISPGYMLTSLTRTILDKNEELKVGVARDVCRSTLVEILT